jgi:hypothetical protein
LTEKASATRARHLQKVAKRIEQKETKETKTDEDRVTVLVLVVGQVVRGEALSESVSGWEVVFYRRKLRKFEQKETKETKTDEDRVSVLVLVIGQVGRGQAVRVGFRLGDRFLQKKTKRI